MVGRPPSCFIWERGGPGARGQADRMQEPRLAPGLVQSECLRGGDACPVPGVQPVWGHRQEDSTRWDPSVGKWRCFLWPHGGGPPRPGPSCWGAALSGVLFHHSLRALRLPRPGWRDTPFHCCVLIKRLLGTQAWVESRGERLPHWATSFSTTDGVSEQDGGSTLQRAAVTKEDSGTYVCWAENRVGRVQAVSFVHVKGRASPRLSRGLCAPQPVAFPRGQALSSQWLCFHTQRWAYLQVDSTRDGGGHRGQGSLVEKCPRHVACHLSSLALLH